MNHWIIAPVILPALLAPFIVLVMRHDLRLQRIFSTGGTVALLAISMVLLYTAAHNPPQVYFLGDWPAPFGIVLMLDRLSAMMVALTALLALAVQLYAIGSNWDARGNHFHALFQFQLMGLCGAFLTGDAFNLFVFFEVLLIASYGLMIHGGGAARLKAGVQYVAYNLVGSTLFLFALATIYSVTGTLNMADLAVKVAELPPGDAALVRTGAVLLLLVFAIKGALVPLQFWLPATYSFAPGPVAALFAVMTKVGAYATIRVFTLIFPPTTAATGTLFADLLLPAALITLVIGSVGVVGATGLARQVTFAVIGSMGTLFIAISQFTVPALAAGLYYLIHSTLTGAVLFLIADLVLKRRGTDNLNELRPPMAQHGLLAALFFAGAIAMAGMPPLSGFIGKLLIMDATRGADIVLIWSTILVTSLALVIGFSRSGSAVFWKSHATTAKKLRAAPKPEPLAFVIVFALLTGLALLTILAGPVMDWLTATSAELFDRTAYIHAVFPPAKE
ncbi:monovalent cation/H+ antiporter subunit D [Pseudorhodobacter sp.]|uniref:monovalent cation/H+ antiporter subunit D n=1 Tax=Pseudorhodobacter sp. TaxID=1934400 RepID=UPI002649A69F|nr:monovalent cation/H+ antiporter subunit D [Pseudorhodobacter sp.]MDN5787678.1 monovalent cation/H+ antiporter subunit D [Pseudorhodobacter sp.]